MMRNTLLMIAVLGFVALAGCRGSTSDEPPVHLNRNMDYMERYEPQEPNPFFADGRAMRPPVPGTVARGMLKADARFYRGLEADGSFVQDVPVPITQAFVLRGRERYNIYCAVCHGKAGDGQGIVMTGGYGFAAIGYHNDRLRQIEDGYLYEVISNGIRTMPGYGQQISVADRWAITAYIRALQRSQHATEGDIPPDILSSIRSGGGP
jgi:mono/diheme cytochrome c family protein